MDSNNPYPMTARESEWENFLERKLKRFEKEIIHDLIREIMFNTEKMEPLHRKLYLKTMYIPALTQLHGNCFFESCVELGLGSDADNLRKAVAYLMYQYQDKKYFIPGQDLSLKELFQLEIYDEIEYVYCKKLKKLLKYTYDIMCMDLCSESSWSILPTNLIMLLMSRIFNVRFHIIKDTDPEDLTIRVVDAYENCTNAPFRKTINLGHILESHFLPIAINTKKELKELSMDQFIKESLYYSENKIKFHKWGMAMAEQKEKKRKKNEEDEENNSFGDFLGFTNLTCNNDVF